jgi:3-oxoacyl-[acyl-carrier-protein] synthase-1
MAIGQAAELIASGKQKRVICGGAQEITWESMCSFDTLDAFSRREDAPAKASRPFDTERDGLVPSGGAACLVLEPLCDAHDRCANILGEIVGYGLSTDGHNIVVPSGKGIERAMNMAINSSELKPEDIDLVLAHATSTPAGDEKEAEALNKIFTANGASPYIFAPKALTGHEFWMAGASQVVYGLLMAHNGFVAGNRNLQNPAPAAKALNLPRTNIDTKSRILLCNASGFGGTNASLVLRAS